MIKEKLIWEIKGKEKYKFCEEFYGKDLYKEIDYKSTEKEQEIGEEIALMMKTTLEYVGEEEDAVEDVGELKRYYYFPHYAKPFSCQCNVSVITTKVEGNKGHVWLTYSVARYDSDGSLMCSAGDVLTLLYIEEENDVWKVVKIEEPA